MRLPVERFWRMKRQEEEEDEEEVDEEVDEEEEDEDEAPGPGNGNGNGIGNGNGNGNNGNGNGNNGNGIGRGGRPGQIQVDPPATPDEAAPAVATPNTPPPSPPATPTAVEAPPEVPPVVELPPVVEELQPVVEELQPVVEELQPVVEELPPAVESVVAQPLPAQPEPETTLLPIPQLEVETDVPVVLAPEEPTEEPAEPAAEATPTAEDAALPDPAAGLSYIFRGTPAPSVDASTTLIATSSPTEALAVEQTQEALVPSFNAAEDTFLVPTDTENVPDVAPNSDPFPDEAPEDTAMAGYTGLRSGEKGGIAVGSVAGFAFILTVVLIIYKWRKGTLPQAITPRFLSSRPSSRATTPELKEGLVDPNAGNHSSWHYQDTFAKPTTSVYRSVTKLFRNPLAMNPISSSSGRSTHSRKSWASSIFRARADSRASSRLATRLFLRGKDAEEEIPPLPPAYDRRGSGGAWSVEEGSVRSVAVDDSVSARGATPSGVAGSFRDSVTFGGDKRKSRFSFATVDTSSTAPTAGTGSTYSGVSSVNELSRPTMPPVPNPKLMSMWSSSSYTDDTDSASDRSSVPPRVGSVSPAPTLGLGPSSFASIPLPPEPAVHPLRAHSMRPVVTERKEEEDKGTSWPL